MKTVVSAFLTTMLIGCSALAYEVDESKIMTPDDALKSGADDNIVACYFAQIDRLS